MNMTLQAAETMLGNGWYTAASLGRAMSISARNASGLLYNIRNSSRYQVKVTDLPNRKVKVVAINGRQESKTQLWRAAIFGKDGIKKQSQSKKLTIGEQGNEHKRNN